jgi:hypothetical protein
VRALVVWADETLAELDAMSGQTQPQNFEEAMR